MPQFAPFEIRKRGLGVKLLVGVALGVMSGCVKSVTQSTDYSGQSLPVVSSDPAGDGAALRESKQQLSEVRWQVIERKGPKTPSEQFSLGGQGHADAAAGGGTAPATFHAEEPPEVEGYVRVPVVTSATQPTLQATMQPPTRPATQPVASTQPLTQFFSVPVFSEQGLPVEIVPLMDGKIRLIWTLRNYGGPAVTSSRDAVTARRTVTIAPPDLLPLVNVIQQQLGASGTAICLPKENTIVVTCDRSAKSPVLDMLSKLDISPRQVEIAVRIFEVSRDFDFQQGSRVLARHVGTDNSQTGISVFDPKSAATAAAAAAGAGPAAGSVMSLLKTFEAAGISIDASFQILADEGLIRMVSSPRMTVAAGQTGYMLAGQELPIQTANYLNNALTVSTTYKPVGVQLYITPQAVGSGRIKLHTISIVSSISGFSPTPTLSGQNPDQFLMNPVIDAREAETAVTIDNGSTLVISGLRMSRTTTREEKVPGLGDLPLLGWMFKNHHSQQQLTDLYFFVTPTLLEGAPAAHPHLKAKVG